jgi:putative DNA primase/helicase
LSARRLTSGQLLNFCFDFTFVSVLPSIPDIAAVLELRALEWSLIPCKIDKKPCLKSWAGAQAARASRPQLRAWHKEFRPVLWAVVAGRISGIVILDFDGAEGLKTLRRLKLEPHVKTGSGGHHIYFRHPGLDIPTVNAKSKKLLGERYPGLDVRSDGGYAACLGANRAGAYERLRSFADLENWEGLPAELRQLLEREPKTERKPEAGAEPAPAAAHGLLPVLIRRALERAQWEGRNNGGLWLAVQLRDNRVGFSDAGQVMRKYVDGVSEKDQHGKRSVYTLEEALSSLKQAYRREPREPWKGMGAGEWKDRRRYTEMDNAHRVLQADGQNVCYLQELRDFGWWDGSRWKLRASAEVTGRIIAMARGLYEEALDLADAKERKQLRKWADTSNSYSHVRGVLGLLKSLPGLQVRLEDFDSGAAWFNCSNGTYDSKTGEFRGHARGDRISRCSSVLYDERARCPRWVDFVAEILDGDAELYAFVQRVLGYCLTGSASEQCMFLLYGEGSNGKSTLLEVMSELWGEYACVTDFEVFLKHVYDFRLEEKIASLRGCYVAVAHEGRQGAIMATDVIKKVVGTSNLTGRFLFQNRFEFRPSHKLFLETNYRPEVHEIDAGFWRRIRPIPFPVSFEGREDRELMVKLKKELPGILNWVIEGNRNWRKSGLGTAKRVEVVRRDYRAESYVLGGFLEERCRLAPDLRSRAYELFRDYCLFAEARREQVMSMTRFGRELGKRFASLHERDGTWYLGLELIDVGI